MKELSIYITSGKRDELHNLNSHLHHHARRAQNLIEKFGAIDTGSAHTILKDEIVQVLEDTPSPVNNSRLLLKPMSTKRKIFETPLPKPTF